MEHLQGLRSFNFLTLPSSISSWIIHKFAVAVIIIWHERDKMKHLWTHDHLKATGSHQVCWKSQGKTLRHIYSRGARAELILGRFFFPSQKSCNLFAVHQFQVLFIHTNMKVKWSIIENECQTLRLKLMKFSMVSVSWKVIC